MSDFSNVRPLSPTDTRLELVRAALGSDPVDASVIYHLLQEQSRLMQAQSDRLGRLLEEVHGLSGAVSEGVAVLCALDAVVTEALKATEGSSK